MPACVMFMYVCILVVTLVHVAILKGLRQLIPPYVYIARYP